MGKNWLYINIKNGMNSLINIRAKLCLQNSVNVSYKLPSLNCVHLDVMKNVIDPIKKSVL